MSDILLNVILTLLSTRLCCISLEEIFILIPSWVRLADHIALSVVLSTICYVAFKCKFSGINCIQTHHEAVSLLWSVPNRAQVKKSLHSSLSELYVSSQELFSPLLPEVFPCLSQSSGRQLLSQCLRGPSQTPPQISLCITPSSIILFLYKWVALTSSNSNLWLTQGKCHTLSESTLGTPPPGSRLRYHQSRPDVLALPKLATQPPNMWQTFHVHFLVF